MKKWNRRENIEKNLTSIRAILALRGLSHEWRDYFTEELRLYENVLLEIEEQELRVNDTP